MLHEPVALAGRKILAYGGPVYDRNAGGFAPYEPVAWRYLSERGGDVYLEGTPGDGLYPHAALFVPAKVRVGMRWEAETDESGTARFTLEVKGREVAPTIYGPRATWTIDLFDARRPELRGTAYRFIEGRGPADVPGDGGEPRAITVGVVPLDGSVTTRPLPTLALRPLGGIASTGLATGGLVVRMLGTANAARDGKLLRVSVVALVPTINNSGGPYVPTTFTLTTAATCATWTPGGDLGATTDCYDPATTLVMPDGSMPQLTTRDVLPDLDDCTKGGRCAKYVLQGIYASAQGVKVLGTEPNAPQELLVGDHAPNPSVVGESLANPVPAGTGLIHLGFPTGVKYASDDGAGGANLFVTVSGRLGYAHLVAGPRVENAHFATELSGRLGIVSRPGGPELTRTTPDGTVEAIVASPNGVAIQPIGHVELPPGHWLAGALRHEGRLFVLTHSGYEGTAPQRAGGETNLAVSPGLGQFHAWETDGTLQPALPISPAIRGAIRATAVQADAQVCWPPGAGAGDTNPSSWKLGGKQPRAVVPRSDGNCVLLLRSEGDLDLDSEGAYAIEGPVPGSGRVAIGFAASVAARGEAQTTITPERGDALRPFATLKSGGFTTLKYRYGALGIVDGSSAIGRSFFQFPGGYLVDAAGNGIWGTDEQAANVLLCGETCRSFPLPEGTPLGSVTAIPLYAVPGGGVAIGRKIIMAPDGTVKPLPPIPQDFVVTAVFPDATTCGSTAAGSRECIGSDGVMRKINGALEQSDGSQVVVVPIRDRILYLLATSPAPAIARVDLATMTSTAIDVGLLGIDGATTAGAWKVEFDGDGTAFALFAANEGSGDARFALVRLDPAAPAAISTPGLAALAKAPAVGFVPEKSGFVAYSASGKIDGVPAFVRIQR